MRCSSTRFALSSIRIFRGIIQEYQARHTSFPQTWRWRWGWGWTISQPDYKSAVFLWVIWTCNHFLFFRASATIASFESQVWVYCETHNVGMIVLVSLCTVFGLSNVALSQKVVISAWITYQSLIVLQGYGLMLVPRSRVQKNIEWWQVTSVANRVMATSRRMETYFRIAVSSRLHCIHH
jgi:hypothetical protein